MAATDDAHAGLEANLGRLAAVRFLAWAHLMSAVIIPFFRDFGGLSFVAIFGLQTWFMLVSFLMEVPTGAVADRFGRRVSVGLGCLVIAAGSLLYGSAAWLPLFVCAEAVFAVGLALVSGADEALAYDTLKALGREADAPRVMARLEAWKLAGIVCGALTGSLVAARLGVRWPMLLQALPVAAAGLVALSLREPPRGEPEAAKRGRTGYRRVLSGGLEHLRHESALRALALDQVACATVAWLVIWLYQLQLARVAIPLAAFGLVHALMGASQVAFLGHLPGVERAVGGRVRLVRLTAVAPALCLLGLAATTHPAASVLLIVVAAGAGLGRPPLFGAAINRRIPSERRATVLSAVSAARTLAVALLYPATGAMLDRSLPVTLAVVGGLGLLAAAATAAPGRLFEEPSGEAAGPA
jgi:MFS family permease